MSLGFLALMLFDIPALLPFFPFFLFPLLFFLFCPFQFIYFLFGLCVTPSFCLKCFHCL